VRLTVLGGSSASPNAGQGCSGYLVDTGGTRLVLDLGPGTLPELRRHADFRRLDGVVVSHCHLDHCLDLLALRHGLAYNPVRREEAVPVWLPPGGGELLARAAAPFDECDEPGVFARTVRVAEYDPGRPLVIGEATVSFAPTVHYLPAWAIRVEAGGVAVGYTGDTGPSADLAGLFGGVSVLVAEGTLPEAGTRPWAERKSLTAAEAGELARAAGAGVLVLTHLWQEFGVEAARERAAAVFPGRVEVARPGLVVES